ncbi:hypothetical protein [Streptomyces sp. Ru72]|uniref:hypothetical protein n=1 Tax=Streptomyces sp. Ru72 TaxID=2080747 RepID=UPI0011B05098|nr:hypothetical protein [Streptomyces sp. Ru72]
MRRPERKPPAARGGRTITLTVPSLGEAATWAVDAVTVPVAAARRVLPDAHGLPLYVGLGALAVAGALEVPVALGLGIGYAVLRHRGPLARFSGSR